LILSIGIHLLGLGVSSLLVTREEAHVGACVVTLIQEKPKDEDKQRQKSQKVVKAPKKKAVSAVKKEKKPVVKNDQKVASKVTPPAKAKEPERERKVDQEDQALDRHYKELQKTISRIQQKEEQGAVDLIKQSIKDIQQKLVEQKVPPQESRESSSSPQGRMNSLQQIYYTQVWNLIKSQWSIPDSGLDRGKNLLAIISIRLNKEGTLLDMKFERESGEPLFDKSAWMAIKRVGNFPPFPPGMSMDSIEIGVRFSPSESS
jgi:TonB family protein